MNTIWAIVFLILALAGVVLRKTYHAVPERELKRRAVHDPSAARLYRAVAYGNSLSSLLWLYIGLTSAASFVLFARSLSVWVSLLIIGPVLWIVFSLLPATRVTKIGQGLAWVVTPPIAWLLNYLHPLLGRGADLVEQRYTAPAHTGLFERDDLLRLIEQQQKQADNRLTAEELEITKQVLTFNEHTVGDIVISRKKIKTVLADDTIGPILIDEMHKSSQDFVLVRDKKGGIVIGSLAFKQLSLDSHGKVRDLMDSTVYYLHEADTLSEALHAFYTTNSSLFVVTNSSEEFVGIITIQTLVKQLLGHVPGEDFDQYTDPTAVANRHIKPKKASETEADMVIDMANETVHESTPEDKDAVKTDEEVVE